MHKQPILFTGSSHVKLAQEICKELNIDLGNLSLNQFPDGETIVQILENVQQRDVFVLQSIAVQPNHYLFELLMMIDALKRASAKSITAVIPYLGYCRQDRKNKPGYPITAKLVANVLTAAGITNLITCDLHSDQTEGFFEVPVEHLHCQQLLYQACKELENNYIIVSPDIGGIKIAESMSKLFNTELALMKKERLSSFEVNMTLIGNVAHKNVLIVDDLCSTAGTLATAAHLCKQQGAKKIIGAITHGIFVEGAIEKIQSSPLDHLFITNTVESRLLLSESITTVSVSSLISKTILKLLD